MTQKQLPNGWLQNAAGIGPWVRYSFSITPPWVRTLSGTATLYLIPFDPTKTVSADYDKLEPVKDNTGDIVSVGGRIGWF